MVVLVVLLLLLLPTTSHHFELLQKEHVFSAVAQIHATTVAVVRPQTTSNGLSVTSLKKRLQTKETKTRIHISNIES